MAARPVLIVLVVHDVRVRSMLAERLAAQGADLLTASGWEGGLFDRPVIRQPAILIVDEAVVSGDWIERQRLDGRWRHIAMLTIDPPESANGGEWLVPVHRRSAGDILPALCAEWTRDGTA